MSISKVIRIAKQLDDRGFYHRADSLSNLLIKIASEEANEVDPASPPFSLNEGVAENDPDTVMKYFIGFAFDMFSRDPDISRKRLDVELEKKISDKIAEMSPEDKLRFDNLESEVFDVLNEQPWYKKLIQSEEVSVDLENTGPDNTPAQFIEKLVGPAQQASANTGNVIPPSVIIAMSALESRWGNSILAKNYGNYFGVKQSSNSGTKASVVLPTYEYDEEGNKYKINAEFASYEGDAIAAMSTLPNFLKRNPRYQKAIEYGGRYGFDKENLSVDQIIDLIFAAGYSTDKKEPSKIKNIINDYNLTQYD